MSRLVFSWFVLGCGALAWGEEPPPRLPQPDFQPRPSDPAWLAAVVQLHGHLGPAVIAGARLGMAGLRAVGAHGYFDVEVTCKGPLARPPQSCLLDGLQMGTGATLGKRTLHWVEADQLVVRIKNTRTGRTAELRPAPSLAELLAGFKGQAKSATSPSAEHRTADEHLEATARKIAAMPEHQIAVIHVTEEGKQP